ncbi:uncharacterized protein PV09_03622 [Verruconis gallopava]|uniref:C2H2-type domain-containing protein n=1 Tax=Verruconis gallopava TaxID=253628 RepID=A0A0D1XSQ1_9PEZI|nr:uncharacterized protein PV09_03622 [Verruconis gallopava]KIW05766.1 hypothetical protein PV09_03622 [Verruconis gallopava]
MPDTTGNELSIDVDNGSKHSLPRAPSTAYLCNSCQTSFRDGQEQRAHMKEPWHLYNIKRRIASLPPISFDEFDQNNEKNTDSSKGSIRKSSSRKASARIAPESSASSNEEKEISERDGSDEMSSPSEDEQSTSPFQCLFCNLSFSGDEVGFGENLEHMCLSHGLTIPDPDCVVDIQSLVEYLAIEVRVWHECLYCGAMKSSTQSIQSHMRDKGHCLLNLDREPELLDFWEYGDDSDGSGLGVEQEGTTQLSATEIRFASGKVIGSRHAATTRRAPKKGALVTSALSQAPEDAASSSLDVGPRLKPPQLTPESQHSPGRQLVRRDAMGIIGISDQQKHALVLAEKKAQRSEAVARRAREWAYAKAANSQKFDQLDNQHKWGKQQHKLLPR